MNDGTFASSLVYVVYVVARFSDDLERRESNQNREEEILPRANERHDETKVRKLSRGSKKLVYASFSWAPFKFYEC